MRSFLKVLVGATGDEISLPQVRAHTYHTPRNWTSTDTHRSVTKSWASHVFCQHLSPNPSPHLLTHRAGSPHGPQPQRDNNNNNSKHMHPSSYAAHHSTSFLYPHDNPGSAHYYYLSLLFHSRESEAWTGQKAQRLSALGGKAGI